MKNQQWNLTRNSALSNNDNNNNSTVGSSDAETNTNCGIDALAESEQMSLNAVWMQELNVNG